MLLIVIGWCNIIRAQTDVNWYFGDKAAIKFTANGPVSLTNSQMTATEGSSAISDVSGNLLFYSNGNNIWNKKHRIMKNGENYAKGYSAIQSCIIVPMPGSDVKYYIFTSPEFENGDPNLAGHTYSIVDMSLENGDGAVIQKNIVFQKLGTEGITAIQHANGKDFWIITQEMNTSNICAYLLTEKGLDLTNIVKSAHGNAVTPISSTSLITSTSFYASPNGKYLIRRTLDEPNQIPVIFQFNAANGVCSEPIFLNWDSRYTPTPSSAFSSGSNKLYVVGRDKTNLQKGAIFQFDLDEMMLSNRRLQYRQIPDKKINLLTNAPSFIGFLKLAIDGKIYVSINYDNSLSIIDNADGGIDQLNITNRAVSILPARTLSGFIHTIQTNPLMISSRELSCRQFELTVENIGKFVFDSVKWITSDGVQYKTINAVHTFRSGKDTGYVEFWTYKEGAASKIKKVLFVPIVQANDISIQNNECVNSSVKFEFNGNNSNTTIQYYWDLGDGIIRNGKFVTKKYPILGSFQIAGWAIENGCTSDTLRKTIEINKQATPLLKQRSLICTNELIQWVDSSIISNVTVSGWGMRINQTELLTGVLTSPEYQFNTSGIHQISYWLNTSTCDADTLKLAVLIHPKPQVAFVLPQNCVKDLSVFQDQSSITNGRITSWSWNFGDENASPSMNESKLQHPSHQYSKVGNYKVSLRVMSEHGCTNTITKDFIVNGALPEAFINLSTLEVCSNDSILIQNKSKIDFGGFTKLEFVWGTQQYTYNHPKAEEEFKLSYPIMYSPSDTLVSFRMQIFSGISCSSSLDTLIRVFAKPALRFDTIMPICNNATSLVLNQGSITNGLSGSGIYEGTLVKRGQLYPSFANVAGYYPVKYHYTTVNGCKSSIQQQVLILPVPAVNAGHDQVVLEGDSLTLDAKIAGANIVSMNWSPASWLNRVDTNVVRGYADDDIYYSLQVKNAEGCESKDEVFIKVLNYVIPPNAFTPNGDGIHDTWNISGLSEYPDARVQVFDRYGSIVFETKGYYKPWDGKYKGKPLPVATYYYIISPGKGRKQLSGSLTLLR